MIKVLSYLILIIGVFYILFGLLQLHFMGIYPQDEYRFTYLLWSFPIGIGCVVLATVTRLLASSD